VGGAEPSVMRAGGPVNAYPADHLVVGKHLSAEAVGLRILDLQDRRGFFSDDVLRGWRVFGGAIASDAPQPPGSSPADRRSHRSSGPWWIGSVLALRACCPWTGWCLASDCGGGGGGCVTMPASGAGGWSYRLRLCLAFSLVSS